MIKLYGIFSHNVTRVKAALEFKKLPYEQISVDLKNKSPEFLKLNPNGKIPTLVDSDGTIVYESINIVMYLDQKYPDSYKMISDNIYEKVKQLNLIGITDNIAISSYPAGMKIFNGMDAIKEIEEVKPKIQYLSDSIVSLYGGNKYLTGSFSIADAALLGIIFFTNKYMPELGNNNLSEWFNLLTKDQDIKRILP